MKTTIQQLYFDLVDLLENNDLEDIVIHEVFGYDTLGELLGEHIKRLKELEDMCDDE